MNMKKLMSIGAMTLVITCSTSITTFAAENDANKVGDRKVAVSNIDSNFYEGKEIINNVNITINTPIKDYATTELIDDIKELNIADFDINLGIKENIEKISKNQGSLTTDPNLQKVKNFINGKLEEFTKASNNRALAEKVKEYINVGKDRTLTTGKNMEGKTTVSLEDKYGNILLQVNSDEVNEVKDKLTGVDSWGELNDIIKKYFGINFN